MDLPTYTSIWRIEKRLYKLYDFRLPMPLPVGQIAVFAGIAVPYVILLTLFGLPFNHTLFWLYALPPGVLTWLATRPVLESKRLPELVISQLRYLGEPRTWCRLAPLAESDEIQVVARVWRRAPASAPDLASQPQAESPQPLPHALPAQTPHGQPEPAGAPVPARESRAVPGAGAPVPARESQAVPGAGVPVPARESQAAGSAAAPPRRRASFPLPGPSPLPGPVRPAFTPPRPDRQPHPVGGQGASQAAGSPETAGAGSAPSTAAPGPATSAPAGFAAAAEREPDPRPAAAAEREPDPGPAPAAEREPDPGPAAAAEREPDPGPAPAASVPGSPSVAAPAPGQQATQPPAPAARPVRIVSTGEAPARPTARQVERVLSGPADQRSSGWRDHVTVVPGGHVPGRPDQVKRDRARAAAALDGHHLAVVLGCTVGAGQTVTAMMLADLLARLRPEPVAALDLNPGPASLADQALTVPAATVSGLLAGRDAARPAGHFGGRAGGRLEVIAQDAPAESARTASEQEYRRLYDVLTSRYPLVIADPGAMAVARALTVADQLILVAPASPDAARATAMTLEWLDANGYGALITGSVAVMNGVSKRTAGHTEQAETVVRGRCRAIVRVPWDDHLGEPPAERGLRGLRPGPGTGSRLDQLRPPVLDAYTALAGVVVSALAANPARRKAVQ